MCGLFFVRRGFAVPVEPGGHSRTYGCCRQSAQGHQKVLRHDRVCPSGPYHQRPDPRQGVGGQQNDAGGHRGDPALFRRPARHYRRGTQYSAGPGKETGYKRSDRRRRGRRGRSRLWRRRRERAENHRGNGQDRRAFDPGRDPRPKHAAPFVISHPRLRQLCRNRLANQPAEPERQTPPHRRRRRLCLEGHSGSETGPVLGSQDLVERHRPRIRPRTTGP